MNGTIHGELAKTECDITDKVLVDMNFSVTRGARKMARTEQNFTFFGVELTAYTPDPCLGWSWVKRTI